MNHLSASHSSNLKITQFDMSSYFYTNTFLFKNLKIQEKALNAFDMLLAVVLVILFAPIMIAVAIAIKVSMGGKVFYQQVRVGKNGKDFKIIKFRSMIENAEAKSGPTLSSVGDARVTKLGRFLRASHLDELPQLFNVLMGEMSFVGPRPERPEFVDVFELEIINYNKRTLVKPGITGLAQICLSYDAKPHEKLEYDLYYIEHQESLLFNFMIIYYTAIKMLTFHKNQ